MLYPEAEEMRSASARRIIEWQAGPRCASLWSGIMVNFLFKKDQRVKVRTTGEVGTVEYCSTASADPNPDVPFYRVKFADGMVRVIAENELWPA